MQFSQACAGSRNAVFAAVRISRTRPGNSLDPEMATRAARRSQTAARVFITGNSSHFAYLSCFKQIAAALKTPGESSLKIVLYDHQSGMRTPALELL
jgi:hypothetical protein